MCDNMLQNIQTCSTKYVGNMNKYASQTEKTDIYIYIYIYIYDKLFFQKYTKLQYKHTFDDANTHNTH